MIDDYNQAMELMNKMESQFPIPVRPTGPYIRMMRERGIKIKRNERLQIKRVLYLGDEGGIICDVTPNPDAKEVYLVSLTHLEVEQHHPLARDIRAYQKKRNRRIAQSNQSGQPGSFTIFPDKKRKR